MINTSNASIVHPSGLRGKVGYYGQFMAYMRTVRAEILYLTARRDSQSHDFSQRLRILAELDAADIENHARNIDYVTMEGLDVIALRHNTLSIMHVDHTVLVAVYAAISLVTNSLADRQRLLGLRFWTEGSASVIGQINTALRNAGITNATVRGRVMASNGLWAAIDPDRL